MTVDPAMFTLAWTNLVGEDAIPTPKQRASMERMLSAVMTEVERRIHHGLRTPAPPPARRSRATEAEMVATYLAGNSINATGRICHCRTQRVVAALDRAGIPRAERGAHTPKGTYPRRPMPQEGAQP
jgi:hypothetical protein